MCIETFALDLIGRVGISSAGLVPLNAIRRYKAANRDIYVLATVRTALPALRGLDLSGSAYYRGYVVFPSVAYRYDDSLNFSGSLGLLDSGGFIVYRGRARR